MATIVLGAVGTAIGAGFGSSILGLSGAVIGGMIGSAAGSMVDSWIVSALMPGQRIEGPRLDSLRLTSATEGVVIPRLYGRMRIGGNIIWATDFREEVNTRRQGGGKGGGPKVTTTEYSYYASFAVALCEGSITGIGRVWADGEVLDLTDLTWRWYPGNEVQEPDPFIAAKMGGDRTPAYRGTAYVVFEELPLARFGNRLPQLSFEVFRPLADPDTAEGLVPAVTIIPASGEFAYATETVHEKKNGADSAANVNAMPGQTDMAVSLDRLAAMVPSVTNASLVVSWFGDDLRAGSCSIRPKVEMAVKNTTPAWSVNGIGRSAAQVVSQDDQQRPVYGGTPADFSVVQAIREMKARGLRVTFYPFLMMDVPRGNALPDPYSDNAASIGQPVLPWRGRITCSPAAGYAGSVNKTSAAATQVAAFFGVAQPGHFAVIGTTVTWTGPATDWGLRRMILHYAHLCKAAGGVDAFLIGSEMRGLTQIRSGATAYPGVAAFRALAADVRSILGPGTKISYAADWSEYHSHRPDDGSNDVLFNLDPLWADQNIDFIGIDNYFPIADWRDGWDHLDAKAWPSTHNRAYLQSNIAGGEGYEWFYASPADRAAQIRTPIRDTAHGQDWIFRQKDIQGWWSNPHHSRIGSARPSGIWQAGPYPRDWPLVLNNAPAQPVDDSFDSYAAPVQITSTGNQNAGRGAWFDAPETGVYHIRFILRPGPNPPAAFRVLFFGQGVGSAAIQVNFATGGSGRSAFTASWQVILSWVSEDVAVLDVRAFLQQAAWRLSIGPGPALGTDIIVYGAEIWPVDASGLAPQLRSIEGSLSAWLPASKPIIFTELGCPAVDRGPNQPNVFHDPKSSESFVPYFSRGWRDDAVQRAYLEASYSFWRDPVNNPVSSVYGAPMVDVSQCAAWTWDARPYPFFPELADVWSDGANWRLGHWLTGRLGAVSLAALVRDLCRRAGMPDAWIDTSVLTGAVDGYVISALESPRTSITMLARHFGFDAVESEGRIRFVMRGGAPVATISPEDMVDSGAEVMELTRGQETELPQALKWQLARSDEDYDTLTVEARRITVEATRIGSDSFPMAVPPEEADRRCRRALMEAWQGRERASFRLPPSQLALEPADAIRLEHDGRALDYRLLSIGDADARVIEAIRQDRDAYDLPPGSPRPASLSRPVVFGAPEVAILDLPQLREDHPAHHPLIAAHAKPWPGQMAVFRSPEDDGFDLVTTFTSRARMGVLTEPLHAGPVSRFDHGNAAYVEMLTGTLESVSDLRLFAGENALAVEQPSGAWEIVQFGRAELLAPGRYRLSRLLRGQRGTEAAMGPVAVAGVRIVLLDDALADLPVTLADLGLPANWRIGPAAKPVSDPSFAAITFTPTGAGLRPFAPVHVTQPWRHPRQPGDLILRCMRRDRALAADSWATPEIRMSEPVEAWQIEILDGAAVKRVLTSATTNATYTAAAQTADWGALLTPGDSLTIRIAQIGAYGPGASLTQTLWF
ncbi:MAG: glycoside hydrolase TIM-barrel-like domain-containing protein [Paracoccus sp. (in: a-proteobacteria)]|nr:glycoside hydrolase TIM-barrel-like domain-containing protein [Paracoccus sp. (in: a-proteobacteria)]